MTDNSSKEIRDLVNQTLLNPGEGIRFKFVSDGYWIEVTTPLLDSSNDYVQFYVRKEGETYIFLDDSLTLYEINSPANKSFLETVLSVLKVNKSHAQLSAVAWKREDFHPTMLHLLAAMILVNTLVEREKTGDS